MSLEYNIYIKSADSLSDTVSLILEDLHWYFEIESINRKLNQYTFNKQKGFILNVLSHNCILEIQDEEHNYEHVITFRIDKEKLNTPYKVDMVAFLIQLRRKIDSPILFLFNGEEVLAKSDLKESLDIGISEFWNSELTLKLKDIDYCEKKFNLI